MGQPVFELPESLRRQLLQFRWRLWSVKVLEAIAFSAIGFLIGFLATYSFDRVFDTTRWMRWSVLTGSLLTCLAIPYAFERWVWKRRRFDQLAAFLTRQRPTVGDQILGVIHLVSDRSEQERSPVLVTAAIKQVAGQLEGEDLSLCLPRTRARSRGIFFVAFLVSSGFLFGFTRDAASSSLNRFLMPWSNTQRYTFAQVESLPSEMIVPKGEEIDFHVALERESVWKPNRANLRLASSVPYSAEKVNDQFLFQLPGQVLETTLDLRVGDYQSQLLITPIDRPELKTLTASVQLPNYLGIEPSETFEVRGSSLGLLVGSQVTFAAEASRDLATATINQLQANVEANRLTSTAMEVLQNQEITLNWSDHYGLSAIRPLTIRVEALEDETPTLLCENLPLRKVLLTSEVLAFQVRAYDDYGVRHVGLQWSSVSEEGIGEPIGETLIGAGGPTSSNITLNATFSAKGAEVADPVIALRAFVEDYHPDHPRQFSSPSFFQILDNAQHAVWLSSELARWHQMSLDVRDRELQLHQTNLELRELDDESLATAETRELISVQAEQERINGRQLSNLVRSGEGLLREAMRNDEIDAEYLENWAEMVQVLKDISANRMPEVADLLEKASKAGKGSIKPKDDSAKVGTNRLKQSATAGESEDDEEESDEKPATPSVTDIESSQLDLEKLPKSESQKQKPQQGRLGLPDTKLAGNAASESEEMPPQDEIEQAVIEQEGLLEEFEKVSDQMNQIMGNLEGSTLVKRLKSASRKQQMVASGLAGLAANTFGVPDREKHADRDSFLSLSEMETKASQEVSDLMDDMTAYFERSRLELLQRVLEQMKSEDVTAGLRDLGAELRKENGLAISQAEYWSDNLDRWAEDLVEVTQSGASPGGKPKGSLPPGIVLEVLQILDDEVQLREQTRVAEQKRSVVTDTEHMNDANRLGELQQDYQQRVDALVEQIMDLPNAEGDFANELNMLGQVSGVMQEATEILYKPQTGPMAIAAETEVIELLLKSKRFNPNASGGSGADPGGGGSGQTEVAALALVGSGINAREIKEESEATQSTGLTAPGHPEEFRGGLDQYFGRLEAWKAK